ncbi:AP2-like ethylene-responsive transcription factor At1g79700 [Tripterygium wilfordii]|uniref:AP2-like ethylene-responsive transcription factor At1g79700 n=1 Tax=Tripterygium wilfordii TaxID=458696 RepID=UPI0018F841A1|nr:AP2-like ethylene-responsive transcription factor At1g79700 [Tripterygium wilfordii]
MEMTTAKFEISPKRHSLSPKEGDAVETKHVKRRRKNPFAAASSSNTQQVESQQQQQSPADQTTASTTTVKRSSRFRGVSRHRWTGRYEAHLWDKGSWNPTQRKKGKQVYLGAYDEEESAARAYDLAALKYWGPSTFTNFPVSEYEKEIEMMITMTKEEYLATLRRRSSGFSRGVSRFRGVARHHHNGRWEARIGRVFGNKYLYLGTYNTQEEAAQAYDVAAIEYRGINAVTNFELSTYIKWLRPGSSPLSQQEQKPNSETLQMATSSPPANQTPRKELTELPFFHSNPTRLDVLDAAPTRQDMFRGSSAVSPCARSSSPTALSLLLRSSIFKELVEKNSNATQEETEENYTKPPPQIGNGSHDNGVREVFYDQIGLTPFQSSSRDLFPGLESKEECRSPFHGRTVQSMWNLF